MRCEIMEETRNTFLNLITISSFTTILINMMISQKAKSLRIVEIPPQ